MADLVLLQPGPLPAGTRLVHIGPHKTGTTAVQAALHEAREALTERGVRYAGKDVQAYREAIGLTGKPGRLGSRRPREADWLRLVAEAREAGDARYVVSSESLANAEPEHVRRLAADLGPRLHVLRMIRRYDRLVTSQWQQAVAAGNRPSLEAYLATVTEDQDSPFWRRHGFVPLTRLWADEVGRDRVSVVVVNEADRGWLLRVFELLLGLDEGFLVAPTDATNRSLTAAEVEVLRTLNQVRVEQDWTGRVHLEYVRHGVSPALRELAPDPLDGRIELPRRVLELLRDLTERDLAELDRLGVELLGDPAWLAADDWKGAGVEEDRAVEDGAVEDGVEEDRAVANRSLRVESAVRAAAAVVERHLGGIAFPLGGAGPRLAARLPDERRRHLSSGERRLVTELEERGWPDDVVDRFVHRGLVRWLRWSTANPGPRRTAAQHDVDRVDPRRVGVGLSGIIAQTDPAAAGG